LVDFQELLGVDMKDAGLLQAALVHSSYVNENPVSGLVSNERLEFLGDAVLGLIIGEKLYLDFPHFDEGQLTRLRADLVRGETLSRIAQTIDLGSYLLMGKGEMATGGREKPANLAAALEAVIAAVYLDRGLEYARTMVLRLFAAEIEKAPGQTGNVDYKSRLQELLQSRNQPPPVYYLVTVEGPDHERKFTIEVRVKEQALGTGTGRSKKIAETEAARIALEKLT